MVIIASCFTTIKKNSCFTKTKQTKKRNEDKTDSDFLKPASATCRTTLYFLVKTICAAPKGHVSGWICHRSVDDDVLSHQQNAWDWRQVASLINLCLFSLLVIYLGIVCLLVDWQLRIQEYDSMWLGGFRVDLVVPINGQLLWVF